MNTAYETTKPERDKQKLIYAKDKKCILCKRKAVAFWPIIDPDIPSNPYCRQHLEERKTKMLMQLCEMDDKLIPKKKR